MDWKEKSKEQLVQFKKDVGYKEELIVSEAYEPYIEKQGKLEPNLKQYPNSDLPGVYIFYSESTGFLYIGKCSNNLGFRIGAHIGKPGDKAAPEYPYPYAESWIIENKNDLKVITIPLKREHFFLAPALETYMIWKLKPPYNARSK